MMFLLAREFVNTELGLLSRVSLVGANPNSWSSIHLTGQCPALKRQITPEPELVYADILARSAVSDGSLH